MDVVIYLQETDGSDLERQGPVFFLFWISDRSFTSNSSGYVNTSICCAGMLPYKSLTLFYQRYGQNYTIII